MKVRTWAAPVALVTMASLALTACSSSQKSGTDSADNAGAVLPSSALVKADYADLKNGGTLTQAVSQLPINWVQLNAADGLGDTATIEGPITTLNGLEYNDEGEWSVNKDYMESAKIIKQDPQTIEVKLNPKAVWSDGTPITWEDFDSMWKAFNGSNKKFDVLSTAGFEDIESVTKGSDDYTYDVVFKNKNADWPNVIYPTYPKSVTGDPDTFNNGFKDKPFPSNGPFVVSDIDTSAGVVTETPNPKWWGKKPKLDKVVFRVVNQDSLGQAFANNEINVLDTQANADVLNQAKKRTDAVIQKSGGLTWTQITFNGTKAPLDDVNVRQAVAMAVNREAMVKVIQAPLGVEPTVQNSYIYVPGQAGYKDEVTPVLPYSPKKAEALLEKSGYAKGSDGIFAKDGKPLEIDVTVPSDTPTNAQRAQLIEGFLAKVGISSKTVTVPTAKYFDDYVLKLDFQLTSFSWQGTPFPVSTAQPLFNPADAGQNYTGITDDKLGPLWSQANAALDPKEQQDKVHEIDTTIANLTSMLPLGTTPTIWAVQKGIANIGADQWTPPYFDYSRIGFTK